MNYWKQPDIDPVLIHLFGPFQIRWYSLLYVSGFIIGRWMVARMAKQDRWEFEPEDVERYVLWCLLGAVIGARVFYCFVYDPGALIKDPLYLFRIYKGGLSFHGGFLGVVFATIIFCRKYKIPFWNFMDAVAIVTPIGLGLGRLGNFINGELYGRVTDVPWAVLFKNGGPLPRHPSQLYEGFLEGVVLFFVLWFMKDRVEKDGIISLTFLVGYTTARFIVEFFREPDSHLGYLLFGLSMGQLLSVVMLVGGGVLIYLRAKQTT